jgi:hypothetical protein
MFHLLGDAPMLNTPGYRARALDWMCGGGATRFYLAQTNLNADNTAQAILHALGSVSRIAA